MLKRVLISIYFKVVRDHDKIVTLKIKDTLAVQRYII